MVNKTIILLLQFFSFCNGFLFFLLVAQRKTKRESTSEIGQKNIESGLDSSAMPKAIAESQKEEQKKITVVVCTNDFLTNQGPGNPPLVKLPHPHQVLYARRTAPDI